MGPSRGTGYVSTRQEVNMIAGVRPRNILVLPRRAWRVFKAAVPKPKEREERPRKMGLFESLEQMFSYQVDLAFREFRD